MTDRAYRLAIPTLLLFLAACGGDAENGEADSPETSVADQAPPAATEEGTPMTVPQCTLEGGAAPTSFDAGQWTGEYALVMLGPDGDRTTGRLTLVEQAPDLQSVVGPGGQIAEGTRIPLYGWTDIDAEKVGATIPGSATAEEPEAPGVILLESSLGGQPPSLMFRLGSEANRRGQTRFDGAFTVLRVTAAGQNDLRGRWTSGVDMDRAEGTFCAFRR